jgi:hypothetical protein
MAALSSFGGTIDPATHELFRFPPMVRERFHESLMLGFGNLPCGLVDLAPDRGPRPTGG